MLLFPFIGVLVSSFVASFSGFGFSLVAVPFLMFFFEPRVVVPIIVLHTILLNLLILKECWKYVDIKRIYPLMIFGALGTPFGTYMLLYFSAEFVKIVTGIVTVFFSIILILGITRKVNREKLAFIPIGFVSGLLNGLTTMSGPPVVLFYANQRMKKKTFRANLVIYFLFLNIFTFPVLLFSNVYTSEILLDALKLSPAVILGSFLGIILLKKIDSTLFRRIALIIVLLLGVVTMVSGLNLF